MRYRHKCEQNLSFFPFSFLCLSLCVWGGVWVLCAFWAEFLRKLVITTCLAPLKGLLIFLLFCVPYVYEMFLAS